LTFLIITNMLYVVPIYLTLYISSDSRHDSLRRRTRNQNTVNLMDHSVTC